jgi:hypothetical protein
MTTQALINYDEEFARIAEETREALTATTSNFISTKGKLFTFSNGPSHNTFDCIVIDYIRINSLMPPFNASKQNRPRCWAQGRADHLLAPSPSVTQPQADSCAACALNKFGSATNGSKGKACTNTYRLALVPPDATKDSDIWLLKVSPTSLARWTHYVKLAEANFGAGGFCRVVTNLSFDPNKDYPSLIFKIHSPISNPEVVLGLRKRACDEIMAEPSSE